MASPTVSFIVPCYKLAHLLSECVSSILSQSFKDLEVLIMDDCSPDNTAEIAQSFQDYRVKYIRNDPNLGHLKNYNKGISLAKGNYIWLISADDYLHREYVLEKYVSLLDKNPNIGYAFCPGVAVGCSDNSELKEWVSNGKAVHGEIDQIFNGHVLLKKLLLGNSIVAASGLVRRECYDKMGLFPLNMPWSGDWYLWCLFALQFDAGYFAEPMVCYREHELSMTNKLWEEDVVSCCEEDVSVPWAIKSKADELGYKDVSKSCLEAVSYIYFQNLLSERYRMNRPSLSLEQLGHSVDRNAKTNAEKNFVLARVFARMANEYYWRGENLVAKQYYKKALSKDLGLTSVYAKYLLLSLGRVGGLIWKLIKN